eukprot:CFRG7208T1
MYQNSPTSSSTPRSCYQWDATGTCKFGNSCRYIHNPRKSPTPSRDENSIPERITFKHKGSTVSETKDSRFVKQLSAIPIHRLAATISRSEEQWAMCWTEYGSLDTATLQKLVETLARLPFSAKAKPPPIHLCERAVGYYLDATMANPTLNLNKIVVAVEIVVNAVHRLLKFEWDVDREQVREALVNILVRAEGCLKKQNRDHRVVADSVMKLISDVEKPWAIKEMVVAVLNRTEGEEGELKFSDWRTATVRWLSNSNFFRPSMLPVMKTPESASKGVYHSRDEYIDIVHRLWVGMTFFDGNCALSPRCRHNLGQKLCDQPLWPLSSERSSFTKLHCRTRYCNRSITFACPIGFHNDALCSMCAAAVTAALVGPPGGSASTHIYDGIVRNIDADGKLYISQFKSRRPPQRTIHWRSTRRLSSPALVGMVKLQSHGAPLKPTLPISWGEVGCQGHPKDEAKHRMDGNVVINMASILEFSNENFRVGDFVAMIDCQTFVPEFMPVLKAMEQQRLNRLPFDDGNLLNLCINVPSHKSVMLDPTSTCSLKSYNITQMIETLIYTSRLKPIMEIRRNKNSTETLRKRLLNLVKQATLDSKQLASFIDSLKSPVHLTQGPPGTGKSYLGVVIVRALLIIRSLWIDINGSAGTPPILVLSYKNHAIDEFLVDLISAESTSSLRYSLIRIGGSCNDPRLIPYAERTFFRSDREVASCRREIEDIHKLRNTCKAIIDTTSTFLAFRVEMNTAPMMEGTDDDVDVEEITKKRLTATYEATDMLAAIVYCVKTLQDVLVEFDDTKQCTIDDIHGLRFMMYEIPDAKGKCFLRNLSVDAVTESIPILREGIKHHGIDDPHEVILQWLRGHWPV